jgi:hypothetical protein
MVAHFGSVKTPLGATVRHHRAKRVHLEHLTYILGPRLLTSTSRDSKLTLEPRKLEAWKKEMLS